MSKQFKPGQGFILEEYANIPKNNRPFVGEFARIIEVRGDNALVLGNEDRLIWPLTALKKWS